MLDRSEVVKIELELTGWCNLNCPMCAFNFLDDQNRLKKQPDINELTQFLDSFPKLETVLLIGEYSEPLAYKDIFLLIEYLNNRNIKIKVNTNGSLFTTDWWKKLSASLKDKDQVIFAIDGHTQALHEKYRVGASLVKVVENLKAFMDNTKKHDAVQTIHFEYNDPYFNDITEFVKNTGTHDHIVVDCKPHLNSKIHDRGYLKSFDTVAVGPTAAVKRKQAVVFGKIDRVIENKQETYTIECYSKRTKSIFVTNELKILPCCEFAKLYKKDKHWDQTYETIEAFNHTCCAICEHGVRKLADSVLGPGYLM
jgi:MoaA/NifB/PqqE/SkfB family radical SAM enzyme